MNTVCAIAELPPGIGRPATEPCYLPAVYTALLTLAGRGWLIEVAVDVCTEHDYVASRMAEYRRSIKKRLPVTT